MGKRIPTPIFLGCFSILTGGCFLLIVPAIPVGKYAVNCFVDGKCPELQGASFDTLQNISKESEYQDVSTSGADQLKGPGTVLTISSLKGIKSEGNILDCTKNANDESSSLVEETSKDIEGKVKLKRIHFDRFASLIDVGPDYEKISTVNVEFKKVIEARIEYQDLISKLLNNRSNFPEDCVNLLRNSKALVVLSALRIEGVSYELRDSSGRLIDISSDSIKNYYLFGDDSTEIRKNKIYVSEPKYIAIGSTVTFPASSLDRKKLVNLLSRHAEIVDFDDRAFLKAFFSF